MPRIFGVNIIATLVAGFAFWMLGYVWFGVVFSEAWQALHAFTPEEISAGEANMGPLMAMGFLVALISAGFLSFMLNKIGATGMVDAIKMALVLCFGFVVLTQLYDPIYAMSPMQLFYIDASYQVVGFALMAVILTAMKNVLVKD